MSGTMRRQNEPSEDLGPAPDDSYRENAYDNAHEQGESNSNDELSEKIGEELVEPEYHLNPDNKIIGDSDWEGPSPTRSMQLHRLQREYRETEPIRREEASKAAEEEELIQKLQRENDIETAKDEIEAYIQRSLAYAANHIPQRKMKDYENNLRNLARSSTDSEVWAKRKTRMTNLGLYELVKKLEQAERQSDSAKN